MKVCSINVCLLSCQFYYTYGICKYCVLLAKKAMHRYIDLTVEAYENISKYQCLCKRVPLNSIIDILCSTRVRGRPKSDGCRCKGRGGQNFSLCGVHK